MDTIDPVDTQQNKRLLKAADQLRNSASCSMKNTGINLDNCKKQWNTQLRAKDFKCSTIRKLIDAGVVDVDKGLISNCRIVETNDKRKILCKN